MKLKKYTTILLSAIFLNTPIACFSSETVATNIVNHTQIDVNVIYNGYTESLPAGSGYTGLQPFEKTNSITWTVIDSNTKQKLAKLEGTHNHSHLMMKMGNTNCTNYQFKVIRYSQFPYSISYDTDNDTNNCFNNLDISFNPYPQGFHVNITNSTNTQYYTFPQGVKKPIKPNATIGILPELSLINDYDIYEGTYVIEDNNNNKATISVKVNYLEPTSDDPGNPNNWEMPQNEINITNKIPGIKISASKGSYLNFDISIQGKATD